MQLITDKLSGITQFIVENGAKAPRSLLEEMQTLEAQRDQLEIERSLALDAQKKIDAQQVIDTLKSAANMTNHPPEEQKQLVQQAVKSVTVTDETYRIILNCQSCGGGEGN